MRRTMLVAVLLAAAPAAAQQAAPADGGMPAPPPGGPGRGGGMGGGMGMLRMADRNGDGVVTREEYLAAVDARFAREDRNGDGVLAPDELPRGRMRGPGGDVPPPPPPNGTSPDATGTPPAPSPASPPDGARGPVTRAQYREMAMRRFDRLDTNGDGRIDQAEMAAMPRMGPRRGGGAGEATPPPPPPGE